MENTHSILYNYYSKYNGGNTALRISKSLTKLAPLTKMLLKEVIEDIPGKMKESVRDQIASDIFQGKNPLESFSKGIINRAYNELKSSEEYDRKELDTVFNKGNVILDSRRNTSILQNPVNYVYNKESYNNTNRNRQNGNELYGGLIEYKVAKYYNKLKLKN